MKKFVARQPIFDAEQNVFAYELLFRTGMEDFFNFDDSDQAASSVIVDSFLLFGLETLTGGQKAFINCTREMLVKGYMALLPKEQVVVEILETVEPDEEIIGACLRLKRAGYLLALDDFVYEDKYEPLLELADIIKVDFQATEAAGRKSLVERMAPRGVKLLAEKVESKQEFEQAVEMGYDYFQGYFFSRPQILSGQDVPGYKLNYLRVLQAVNRPEVNLREIENVIKQDVSLTYKLLRYLNSAFLASGPRSSPSNMRWLSWGRKRSRSGPPWLPWPAWARTNPRSWLSTPLSGLCFARHWPQSSGCKDEKRT